MTKQNQLHQLVSYQQKQLKIIKRLKDINPYQSLAMGNDLTELLNATEESYAASTKALKIVRLATKAGVHFHLTIRKRRDSNYNDEGFKKTENEK